MTRERISRRRFVKDSVLLAGAVAAAPWASGAVGKIAASDLVPLGKTGRKISRLGFGTGSNGGEVQKSLGQAEFTRLIRYAYDHGIRYIDTADNYGTHPIVRQGSPTKMR